jgi:hypothetical protein
MPNFESYCRCPGCGECSAHANALTLNKKLKELQADNKRLRAALVDCENALADYIPTLESHGGMMGYGKFVLKQARAALEGK